MVARRVRVNISHAHNEARVFMGKAVNRPELGQTLVLEKFVPLSNSTFVHWMEVVSIEEQEGIISVKVKPKTSMHINKCKYRHKVKRLTVPPEGCRDVAMGY